MAGWFTLAVLSCQKETERYSVASPDSQVQVEFLLVEGKPHYVVSYKNSAVIDTSGLGLVLENSDAFTGSFQVRKVKRTTSENQRLPVYGTSQIIRNHYTQMTVLLEDKETPEHTLGLVFRAFDDGIAFRYFIPGSNPMEEVVLGGEKTQFNFAGNYKSFATKRPSFQDNYEKHYKPVALNDLEAAQIYGVPLLLEGPDFWAALTEAALKNYAGMSLKKGDAEAQVVSALAPLPDKAVKVSAKLPLVTPWRVLMLGDNPGALIESQLVVNLNSPSKIGETSWIKPGKAIWPWWNNRIAKPAEIKSGEPGTKLMKYYIDFAAEHSIPYIVVDAGWYSLEGDAWDQPEKEDVLTMEETRTEFYDIHEVLDYAQQKEVDVWLWVHLASLKGRIDEVVKTYAEWGAAGIKLDNFGGDDQETVNTLHEVIRATAAHELLLDYHGAYKPTGIRRTYPHFITREAVMGLEFAKWSDDNVTPEHDVTIPFTRMLAGPMDYTSGAFDLDGTKDFPKKVNGTRAHQMAMFVVYYSPVQMLVDYPSAYNSAPRQFEFLKNVPVSWHQTHFIDGYPGDFIVMARRKGANWYVGGMSDEQAREASFKLDFLDTNASYTATVYKDGSPEGSDREAVEITSKQVNASTEMTVPMAPGGGFAIEIKKAE